MRFEKNLPVFLEPEAYFDLVLYASFCPVEISGTGKLILEKEKIIISEIFIVSQVCSPFFTVWTTQGQIEIRDYLREKKEDFSNYAFWWHSHLAGKWWSELDFKMIKKFCSQPFVEQWVSLLYEKKTGEMIARIDLMQPKRKTFDAIIPRLTRLFRVEEFLSHQSRRGVQIQTEIENKVFLPGGMKLKFRRKNGRFFKAA